MNEQETKRTIDEVLDVETGEIIKADFFFKKPESEIIAYRRRLQEAIAGFEPPKYRCAYCNQLLKLSGKSTKRGEVSYFSHLYDSDDCEIKTNGDLTKEEIEARKYGNVRESERHILLKNKLAYFLKSTPEISNVEIEKRLISEVPYLYWRQPDVYAEYKGKSIVFELQLSTTFLSVIIARDIFYRINNTFIVWVFNFSDNKEYVNFHNLMIKDIYYANKRNAFVFDKKAQELSEETGELHLLCIWFEPLIINGKFQHNEGISKEKYIKLSDLKFDNTSFKPYYIDGDALFSEYQSGYFESKIDLENLQKLHLEKIAKKNKERENIQLLKEKKIAEIKDKIVKGTSILTPFQKGKKWGYEADNIEIIEPKYSEVTDFSNSNYVKVKFNRKYGFINKFGEFVFDPIFIEAFEISNNKCIGKYEKDWCIIDLENKSSVRLECFDIEKLTDNLIRITQRFTNKVFTGVNNGGYNTYSNEHNDTFSICSMEGIIIKKCFNYKVYKLNCGKLISKIRDYYLCFDENGTVMNLNEVGKGVFNIIHTGIIDINENIIIPFDYDLIEDFIEERAIAKKKGKYGLIDEQGETIIPFDYDLIEDFIDGKAKAKKNDKYGCINKQGEAIIPFDYDLIEDFIDGKAKAEKAYKYGFIDEYGKTLIPFEYNSIEDFIDGKAKANKNGKYGFIDEQGKTLIPFEYNSIENFFSERAKAEKGYKYGFINEQGKILIPFEYDSIEDFIDNRAKAKKDYKYGFINGQGEIIIPFEYDSIENFIGDRAKAKKDFKYGFINGQGEIIIPFEYDSIENFIDDRAKARRNNHEGYIDINGLELITNVQKIKDSARKGEKFGKWGIESLGGTLIIPFEYDLIEDFIDGKAKAEKGYKYGFINEQGKALIPFEYDFIKDFINGKAKAKKGEKYGFIDEQGNTLIPFEYNSIEDFIDGKAKAEKGYKYGFIDKQGKTLIPFEYNSIEDFIDGKAKAKKNGKYGYIDEEGKTLIPFEYDSIGDFINDRAKASRNGEMALIDNNGNGIYIFKETKKIKGKYGETITEYFYGIKDTNENIIITPRFNKIDGFKNGLAKIYGNKQYIGGGKISPKFKYKVGYIDEAGKIAAPCVFDEITEFIEGKATAKKNGKNLVVDIYEYEVEQKNIDIRLFKTNSIYIGKIINVVKFGLFIDLGNDTSALLHKSELNKHQKSLTDYIKGQEIEVLIINIIENRITLTLPQKESQ
jgi:archaellum component FlaG (FlaF/FlaG flagellin family)